MERRREERREARRKQEGERRVLKKYGIALGDVSAMKESQAGRCAICYRSDLPLVVDHCHETGAVRELLCGGCNVGLGFFEDDCTRLLRAMTYVKRHRANR